MHIITGNKNKFEEIKLELPDIKQLDIDLPEIQEVDPREIIKAKLEEARTHHKNDLIVEDNSLSFDCLNNLPGPFIKWFEKQLGNKGMADLVKKYDNHNARASIIIGLARGDEIYFFEGVAEGEIVDPIGDKDFGWSPIFKPKGENKTWAQMEKSEKMQTSMRAKAIKKLKEFLAES